MITVPVPSFDENDLQSAKERKAILDALYALTEQIQRQMHNIDETSFSADYLAKIKATQEAADNASAAAGALREHTISVREALKKEIVASATEVTTEYTAAIKATQEQAESLYVKETEYLTATGALEEELRSLITQTASSLELQFTNVITSSLAQFDGLITRFTFDENGMSINRNTSLTYMLLDNDSISFQKDVTGGVQILAELSAEGLVTYKVVATEVMADSMAADKSVAVGRFKWVDEGSLGFSLVMREG